MRVHTTIMALLLLSSAASFASDAAAQSRISPAPLELTLPSTHAERPLPHYAGLDVDILAIDDRIKADLDRELRPIRDRVKRAQALHLMMFAENRWAIRYQAGRTYTAQQTWDNKLGNCMSMATLYIASARYLDLDARFQSVRVEETWEKRNDYYIVPGHMNAQVKLPRHRIHIEFLRTFFSDEYVVGKETTVISDEQAFAEYHNNIAMELVDTGRFDLVRAHLDRALDAYSRFDYIWSNYGVIEKFQGHHDAAEQKYLKALSLNRRNFSALTNLYVLYMETGQDDKASAIEAKVERYSRRNPYYLAKLAETALNTGNSELALSNINKAIRKDKQVARFYHIQAQAFAAMGDTQSAASALKLAEQYAGDPLEAARYQSKMAALVPLPSDR